MGRILVAILVIITLGCTSKTTPPELVKEICLSGCYPPHNLINVNGTLFFAVDDGVHGLEIWKSDGTDAGTVLLKDIMPGADGSFTPDSLEMAGSNGILFFAANDGPHGRELWKSDGTADGTMLVKDVMPGVDGFSFRLLTDVNGVLFFQGGDETNGYELWKSDGTDAGTSLVKDIFPGDGNSYPFELTDVNDMLFFQASSGWTQSGSATAELWKSDGTDAGTVLVKDIRPGGASSPKELTNVDGTVFFTADDGIHGLEIWKSDGTGQGTVLVKDIKPGAGTSNPRGLANVNGTLFFQADDGPNGRELWKSDGTEDGTVLVKDIMTGVGGDSNPGRGTAVDGTLFFSAFARIYRVELWKSDGTEAGTTLVKDIDPRPWQPVRPGQPNIGSSRPGDFANINGTLFFTADDGIHGSSLWKSDGTEEGTVLVNTRSGDAISASELTDVDGTLFFVHGTELWKMEG